MIKRTWTVCVCTLVVVLLASSTSFATTEALKRIAIDKGLERLGTDQQANGHWNGGNITYDRAHTSAALLAFMEEGFKAGDSVVINGNPYGDVVGEGLQYMYSQMTGYNIGAGVPGDTSASGFGVGYGYSYVDGMALTSLASTGTPNMLAVGLNGIDATGTPWDGRIDGSGAGGLWTHKDVAQNMVDYLVYGQIDTGGHEGGWGYGPSLGLSSGGSADNSTAQWPAIGLVVANAKMSIPTPQYTKDQLAQWIDYIQYMGGTPGVGIHGSSGYSSPTSLNNESKTGGLLVEMLLAGKDHLGVPYTLSHPDVQAAIAYLNREWKDTATGTWYGNFNHPYAMWSVYKGLEVWLGTTGSIPEINNLHAPAPIDAGDTWNYWEDYSHSLVASQNPNGSFPGYTSYWTGSMATAWDINILNATSIADPVIPEPLTMVALIGGIGGLGVYIRKRRMA